MHAFIHWWAKHIVHHWSLLWQTKNFPIVTKQEVSFCSNTTFPNLIPQVAKYRRYIIVLNNLTEKCILTCTRHIYDLVYSCLCLFRKQTKGRKLNRALVKIMFLYNVRTVVNDESGLCLEVSGLVGFSKKYGAKKSFTLTFNLHLSGLSFEAGETMKSNLIMNHYLSLNWIRQQCNCKQWDCFHLDFWHPHSKNCALAEKPQTALRLHSSYKQLLENIHRIMFECKDWK